MPDPDNEKMILSMDAFLAARRFDRNGKEYAALLAPLIPFILRIKKTWMAPDGIPEIRIVTNASANETELRDIADTVCLAEGLLVRSLEIQRVAENTLGRARLPRPLGHASIAKACIMWACAHEIFHYLRRHALVEKHFGSTPETKHALEYDADLCAAASLYRYLQYFTPKVSSSVRKQTTLGLLFFSLRSQLDDENLDFHGTATHPHTAARLLDILGKLAMITDSGVADPNMETEETRRDVETLVVVLKDLETAYLKGGEVAIDPHVSPLLSFILHNPTHQYTVPQHARWDEISPLIDQFSRLPRRLINNEQSIMFFGDHSSAPR